MLAWFDVTGYKATTSARVETGRACSVLYILFHPSPIIVSPVYLSRGTGNGFAFETVLQICPPLPMALSILCSWCVVLYKAALLKRHCQIHL